MEVMYPRCAGLDVHKETVVACVRIGPLPGKKSKVCLRISRVAASLWTYAPLYPPCGLGAAARTFTLLSRFAPVRGLFISSQTFVCNNRVTSAADHYRAALECRAYSPAAMARSDAQPARPGDS